MATYTSLQISNGLPVTQPDGGVVAFARGRVTLTANFANADVLEFVKLPANAVVCGMRLFGDTITTSVNLEVGHSTDQDAYASLTAFDFTGANEWLLTLVQDADAVPTTQEETVTLTATSAPTGGTTGDVYLDVYYTQAVVNT